jgi:hypothetical protein
MQDLSIVGPFVAVGVAIIVVALVYSRQTALSARRLDKLMADRPERLVRFFAGGGPEGAAFVNVNVPGAGATVHHEAHT